MPATDKVKEIQRLTQAANDPERSPAVRLLAARKLLRDTNFSARSLRTAKRVAKLYFSDETQTAEIRKKAASLLEFALSKIESDEDREAPGEIAPSVSAAFLVRGDTLSEYERIKNRIQTPEKLNIGWDIESPGVPKKFIAYYEPADLPAFGFPAAPDFTWTSERALSTVEWTDGGIKYYVQYSPVKPVKDKGLYNRILNPKYVEAYHSWKSTFPRTDNSIFEYELFLCRHHTYDEFPCCIEWTPNITYVIVDGVAKEIRRG